MSRAQYGATGPRRLRQPLGEEDHAQDSATSAATLVLDRGFEGDAHAGDWHRQVSLARAGVHRQDGRQGSRRRPRRLRREHHDRGHRRHDAAGRHGAARSARRVLEISQMGKVCHNKCAIYYQAGDCVMPREGIFAVVRAAGEVAVGDEVEIVSLGDGTCDRSPEDSLAESEARCAAANECREARPKRGRRSNGRAQHRDHHLLRHTRRGRGHRRPRALRAHARARLDAVRLPRRARRPAPHRSAIVEMADGGADVILTCGGTGLGPRDVTPEATLAVCDRAVPGIAEHMRAESLQDHQVAPCSRARPPAARGRPSSSTSPVARRPRASPSASSPISSSTPSR